MRRFLQRYARDSPAARVLWWAILVVSIFPVAFRQVSISDGWWHTAIGKWLVREKSLPDLGRFYWPHTDGGFLVSELRWQWLGDAVLYLLYAGLGDLGLQLLTVICLVVSLFFLKQLGKPVVGSWTLLVLVAASLGTYQLQLPRNAIFSLALYPLVLWIGSRNSKLPSKREYVGLAVVLLLWSCFHGSCILGWITSIFLLGSRVLSGVVMNVRNSHAQAAASKAREPHIFIKKSGVLRALQPLGIYIAVMGSLFVAISFGRRDAVDLLLQPFRPHVKVFVGASAGEETSVQLPKEWAKPHAFNIIKSQLNNLIWKKDGTLPWSNDFWSPLDIVSDSKPIQVSYVLAVLAALCAIVFRNVSVGLLLSWMLSAVLGLGYVRMFGYLTLSSCAMLLVSTNELPFARNVFVRRLGWGVILVWIVYIWNLFLTDRVNLFIGDAQHVSRIGRVPIYDGPLADWIISEFPRARIFTTIESGSFCLLRWDFKKQVLLDGFFAAHPRDLWEAYDEARNQQRLNLLERRFNIQLALIPSTSVKWVDLFRLSDDWRLAAVGNGALVFAHSSLSCANHRPHILAKEADLRQTTPYFRDSLLQAFFVTASYESGGKNGFSFTQWASHPHFAALYNMFKDVSESDPTPRN